MPEFINSTETTYNQLLRKTICSYAWTFKAENDRIKAMDDDTFYSLFYLKQFEVLLRQEPTPLFRSNLSPRDSARVCFLLNENRDNISASALMNIVPCGYWVYPSSTPGVENVYPEDPAVNYMLLDQRDGTIPFPLFQFFTLGRSSRFADTFYYLCNLYGVMNKPNFNFYNVCTRWDKNYLTGLDPYTQNLKQIPIPTFRSLKWDLFNANFLLPMSTHMQGDMEGKGDNYPKKNPIFICDNYQVALVMTQKLFQDKIKANDAHSMQSQNNDCIAKLPKMFPIDNFYMDNYLLGPGYNRYTRIKDAIWCALPYGFTNAKYTNLLPTYGHDLFVFTALKPLEQDSDRCLIENLCLYEEICNQVPFDKKQKITFVIAGNNGSVSYYQAKDFLTYCQEKGLLNSPCLIEALDRLTTPEKKVRSSSMIIDPFCRRGTIGLITGKPKSGKSLFSLAIACAFVTKGELPCFGKIVDSGKALYIDGENEESTFKNRKKLFAKNYGDLSNLIYKSVRTNVFEDGFGDIESLIASAHNEGKEPGPIDLLILDNVDCLTGREGLLNKDKSIAFTNWLESLKNKEITVLVVLHSNDNKTTQGDQGISRMINYRIDIESPLDDKEYKSKYPFIENTDTIHWGLASLPVVRDGCARISPKLFGIDFNFKNSMIFDRLFEERLSFGSMTEEEKKQVLESNSNLKNKCLANNLDISESSIEKLKQHFGLSKKRTKQSSETKEQEEVVEISN